MPPRKQVKQTARSDGRSAVDVVREAVDTVNAAPQRPAPLPWEDPAQQSYADISAQRRRDWAAHLAKMTVPDEFKSWAEAMTAKFGPTVGIGLLEAGHDLDWLTALLVVRYGEAIHTNTASEDGSLTQHWPDAFGPEDLERAKNWWTGKDIPGGLRYLNGEATTRRVITPSALGG